MRVDIGLQAVLRIFNGGLYLNLPSSLLKFPILVQRDKLCRVVGGLLPECMIRIVDQVGADNVRALLPFNITLAVFLHEGRVDGLSALQAIFDGSQ